jgi:hypothetical protein
MRKIAFSVLFSFDPFYRTLVGISVSWAAGHLAKPRPEVPNMRAF